MGFYYADRARETTTTEGTGTLTTAGAVSAYQTLLAGAGGSGRLIPYGLAHRTEDEWEVGLGVVTAGFLTRAVVFASSNSGALVNLSPGTKDVWIGLHAEVIDGATRFAKSCRVATTANITIATALNAGDVIDGVTLAAGDRVLVKDQTTASENGIYVAGVTPARANDFYAGGRAAGVVVPVRAGTVNGRRLFLCDAAEASDVIGTNNLSFYGSVKGPTTSTDNAIARYDGTTGQLIQDSGVTIDDANKVHGFASYSSMSSPADGATVTFDWDADNVFTPAALGGNRTLAVQNVDVGQRAMLRLKQDGTGSRTVTWWPNIYWPGGTEPTLTTTAGHWDWFGFICTGLDGYGDPVFDGFVLGQDFGA